MSKLLRMTNRGTIHLVYPHDAKKISTPDAIGHNLALKLREAGYSVTLYNPFSFELISPEDGDVLLGHATQIPGTLIRRNISNPLFSRRLLMEPFCPGDVYQCGFLDRVVSRADLFLAITGSYWMRQTAHSPFAHWIPKLRHLDLAIDRSHFPEIKTTFSPAGQRRFLFIGRPLWYKNPRYLEQLAAAMPNHEFAWIGDAAQPLAGFKSLGQRDFRDSTSLELVSSYDFLLNAGTADGNPTTILEAMSWGLIPICSPQCGYEGTGAITNIPLNNVDAAASILRTLDSLPHADLSRMQRSNRDLLDTQFSWSRFAREVIAAIESEESPVLIPQTLKSRVALRWGEFASPYLWRVSNIKRIRKLFRGSAPSSP